MPEIRRRKGFQDFELEHIIGSFSFSAQKIRKFVEIICIFLQTLNEAG